MAQALSFASDFKLGHYMKSESQTTVWNHFGLTFVPVPPRPMFLCQVVATVIAGTVQLGVQAWMFTNIEYVHELDASFRVSYPPPQQHVQH